MRRFVVAGAIMLAVAGAAAAKASVIEDAKAAVREKLRDPDSAKFTNVTQRRAPNVRGDLVDVVCGEVNAKNGFGGYSGRIPFAYFPDGRRAYLGQGDEVLDMMAKDIIVRFCA